MGKSIEIVHYKAVIIVQSTPDITNLLYARPISALFDLCVIGISPKKGTLGIKNLAIARFYVVGTIFFFLHMGLRTRIIEVNGKAAQF